MTRLVNADKNIAELLRDEIDGSAPRLVTAVESRGHMVRVKFPGEVVAGESWFIATTAGVPVGASGVVIPMRGNAGYFQEIGAVRGATHSYSHNGSPAALNLTGVGTYATAASIYSGTIQSFMPGITEGLWDVDVASHAEMYRSVATGGSWLYVGDGTNAVEQKLRRLSPQTHSGTLIVNASMKNLTPSSVIDLRYTGFGTAGTTYVVNHGWKITARRVV